MGWLWVAVDEALVGPLGLETGVLLDSKVSVGLRRTGVCALVGPVRAVVTVQLLGTLDAPGEVVLRDTLDDGVVTAALLETTFVVALVGVETPLLAVGVVFTFVVGVECIAPFVTDESRLVGVRDVDEVADDRDWGRRELDSRELHRGRGRSTASSFLGDVSRCASGTDRTLEERWSFSSP